MLPSMAGFCRDENLDYVQLASLLGRGRNGRGMQSWIIGARGVFLPLCCCHPWRDFVVMKIQTTYSLHHCWEGEWSGEGSQTGARGVLATLILPSKVGFCRDENLYLVVCYTIYHLYHCVPFRLLHRLNTQVLLRASSSFPTFKVNLKTHFFRQAF